MGTEEFEEALKSTEVKLARLRSLYEQWFAGIERIEPGVARKDLERMIEILKREQPRNTALRFRLQQLVARYGTYGSIGRASESRSKTEPTAAICSASSAPRP